MSRNKVILFPLLAWWGLPTLIAVLVGAGCSRNQTGLLVLEWRVVSPVPNDPNPCATAGISHVEITVGHLDSEQTPPVFVFPCSDGRATVPLTEGIYRATLAIQTETGSRTVAVFDDVEILGGTKQDWRGAYPPDPPDADTILLPWCGDGLIETDEQCDDATANSDTEPDACRTNCKPAGCGDGIKDSIEQCDETDLGEVTCESLGFAAGDLGCRSDCLFDTSDCRQPRADLSISWTITSDGTTLSDCPSEDIARVRYELTDETGRPVETGYSPCLASSITLPDFPFGSYDIYMQGLNEQGTTTASGTAFGIDHSDLTGTAITIDLVPIP